MYKLILWLLLVTLLNVSYSAHPEQKIEENNLERSTSSLLTTSPSNGPITVDESSDLVRIEWPKPLNLNLPITPIPLPKAASIAWIVLYSEDHNRLAELERAASQRNIKSICYSDKPKLTRIDQCMAAIIKDALSKIPENCPLIYFNTEYFRFNDESWRPIINKLRNRKADLLVDADETKDVSNARDGFFLIANNKKVRSFFSGFFDAVSMNSEHDKEYKNSFDQNLHAPYASDLNLHSLEWSYPPPFIWGKWESTLPQDTTLDELPISVSTLLSKRGEEGEGPEGYEWVEDFKDGKLVNASWEKRDD